VPTVIDELVVRLGLDSSEFDEGEHRLVASLRRMETAAQRGGQQVTETTGRGVLSLFRSIEAPASGLRHVFEGMVVQTVIARQRMREFGEQGTDSLRKVGEQGRETGEQVERGLGKAAIATRVLGVAGLGAFAAYEGLSKAFQAVGGTASRVFSAGLGAGAANMGITQFGALSQALFALGNVPVAQTQGWLANYEVMRRQAQFGQEPGAGFIQQFNTALAGAANIAGIRSFGIQPYQDSPEQVANKLAQGLAAARDEASAAAAGQRLGLDLQQVRALRRAGQMPGGLPAQTAAMAALAPSPDQQSRADRYVEATNRLSTAWENVLRSAMLGGLATALTRFANWLDRLISPRGEGGGGLLSAPPKPGEPGYWLTPEGNVAPAPSGATPQGGGGDVLGSVFGNYQGRYAWNDPHDRGAQAGGQTVQAGGPGIALPTGGTLGQEFEVTAPNGQTYRLRQTDVGPDSRTGRGVDINAAAAEMMGYTPDTFPTGGRFTVRPAGTGQPGAAQPGSAEWWNQGRQTGSAAGAEQVAAGFAGAGSTDPRLQSFVRSATGLDPATAAWCAAFADAALASQGISGPRNPNVATSWEAWGRGVSPENVQRGDVMVLPRGQAIGGVGGHVGFATGEHWGKFIQMLSGNEQGTVGYTWEDPSQAVIRRGDLSTIRQANAAGATITNNHDYGDVNLNGNIVVHAPSREAGAIASSTADAIRGLPPLATPANTGLQ